MDKSDENLIEEYLKGRQSAFEELTQRHLKSVYSFALRFVGSEADAEDVAQETFLKAWKNLKKYRKESSKFKTWTLRIARNTAIDFLRKKKHVPISRFDTEGGNVLAETVPDPGALAEELMIKLDDTNILTRALSQLSAEHREILLLHYMSGLTFEDIGDALDEPANTVKSRHRRALMVLRKLLKPRASSAGTKKPSRDV